MSRPLTESERQFIRAKSEMSVAKLSRILGRPQSTIRLYRLRGVPLKKQYFKPTDPAVESAIERLRRMAEQGLELNGSLVLRPDLR